MRQNGLFWMAFVLLSKPETGRYTVIVEHWSSSGGPSSGQAIINVRGAVYAFTISDFKSHWVWTVATIDWPSGTVTSVNTLFDCFAIGRAVVWPNCRHSLPNSPLARRRLAVTILIPR
jgi:hypothetical protein